MALFIGSSPLLAQGLLDSLENLSIIPQKTEYAEATFKAPLLVNGHTIELVGNNELAVLISHRFGPISSGAYNFFGLLENKMRLGLDYGLSKRINLGVGISSYYRTFDGFLKMLLFRQSSGEKVFPVSVVYTSTAYISAEKWSDPNRDNLFSSRLSYSHQLHIARKIGPKLSLQITPGVIHRNLVTTEVDQNNVFSLGFGGRYKLSKHISLNAEYYHLMPGQTAKDFENSLSLGFDIETGGHVFQLLFTNSDSPQDLYFIPKTTQRWVNGDINFGFNIIRVFGLTGNK